MVGNKFKPGELVYYQSFDGRGNIKKTYATVVSWSEFLKYFKDIYRNYEPGYGEKEANRVRDSNIKYAIVFVQWQNDGSISYMNEQSLHIGRRHRLPDFL